MGWVGKGGGIGRWGGARERERGGREAGEIMLL